MDTLATGVAIGAGIAYFGVALAGMIQGGRFRALRRSHSAVSPQVIRFLEDIGNLELSDGSPANQGRSQPASY